MAIAFRSALDEAPRRSHPARWSSFCRPAGRRI